MSRRSRPKPQDYAELLQNEYHVAASQIAGSEFRNICRKWLELYCPRVKQAKGKWMFDGFRWHAYSFGYEQALSGDAAWNAYAARAISPFYLYFECEDVLFDCTAAAWPDVRQLVKDIYIFPHSMRWTFVTTHEMSMGLGPYFAEPSS